MKRKKLPHEVDASFDILHTAGLDSAVELRRLPNGASIISPAKWKDIPDLLRISPSKAGPSASQGG